MATANKKEIGTTGLAYSDGVVEEEFLPQLQGDKARKMWQEMSENDPVIGAFLYAIQTAVRQVTWSTKPSTDDPTPQEEDNAEFVQTSFDDMAMSFKETASENLSMVPYGWAANEIVYKIRNGEQKDRLISSKYSDGKVGWKYLPLRAQNTLERWDFDEAGNATAMVQEDPNTNEEVTIPMENLLHFRTTMVKNNPEGRSVLRNAYKPYFYGKRIESIEAVGTERDLAGLPVAWVPCRITGSSATTTEKQEYESFKKLTRNIKANEQAGIVMPLAYDEAGNKLYDITLLSSGGKRNFDTDKIITRYNTLKLMSVLADFLMVGHEGTGSLALAASKTDVFSSTLGSYLQIISDVYNRQAIPELLRVNDIVTENPPILVHSDIEKISLAELGKYVADLAGKGIIEWDEDLENKLRNHADLPDKTLGRVETE